MLEKSLRSWLSVNFLDEVIIVDWSSQPPLLPLVNQVIQQFVEENKPHSGIPPVRVVRVENETTWVLSRAYNLGVRHARYTNLFKVDCDYVLNHDILSNHHYIHQQSPQLPVQQQPDHFDPSTVFYAGCYSNAKDSNEVHLNGALMISQSLFWLVGGYDERIHTYGFDDEDLYLRLINVGAHRYNISYSDIAHLHHTDKRRAQDGIRFPTVEIDMNSLMLEKINQRWDSTLRASEYTILGNDANTLAAIYVPHGLRELIGEDEWRAIRKLALGRRLHDDYRVPWGMIQSMIISMEEKLLANLLRRRNRINVDPVVERHKMPTFIIIHVQNGLGNRLRTLGSGVAFAEETDREPIIVWEQDVHFGARFDDLFVRHNVSYVILNEFQLKWPLSGNAQFDDAWANIDLYNYMLAEGEGKAIQDRQGRNIYWKSSAIMSSDLTSWETENEAIADLVVRPDIVKMAKTIYGNGMEAVGGVHIRNRSLENDITGVDDNRKLYPPASADMIDKWRAKTTVFNFVEEMKMLLKNGTVDKFYVSSDTNAVCKWLATKFPKNILFISRDCDDRSASCERFALADLLVLSRVKILLGSTWSSFTEAAMRLGGPKALMAGRLSLRTFLFLSIRSQMH